MFVGLRNNYLEKDPILTLMLSRDCIGKYAVTSWFEKKKKECVFLVLLFPASPLWCEVSNVIKHLKKSSGNLFLLT